MFAGMPSRRARWSQVLVAVTLGLGATALALADAPAGRATAAPIVASSDCPEPRRVAPKLPAKPRPEIEPARDRPPSSLPCCKGADCTCSGPPALAASPTPMPAPVATPPRAGYAV
jgi:hypothetical protein